MTSHGAIQTEYKGYHFRGRLEARWARDASLLGRTWGCFMPLTNGAGSFVYDKRDSLLYFFLGHHTTGNILDPSSSAWNVESWPLPSAMVWPKLNEAYRAARGARFEHGEHGESRA